MSSNLHQGLPNLKAKQGGNKTTKLLFSESKTIRLRHKPPFTN